jgi:hypothetical protein
MTTTNDAMYTALVALYPDAGKTLGDLMYAFAQDNGYNFRDTLGYEFYAATGATGTTRGDLANSYWNDPDFAVSNLEMEDGNDLLLEDGSFVLMEAGNG